jgi:pyruvate kinase
MSKSLSHFSANMVFVINEGHEIRVDFDPAAVVSRPLQLDPITPKDKAAFEIGLSRRIKNFALSFSHCAEDVRRVREIIGEDTLISKIESIQGILNLKEILPLVDQILIDWGDLSREVAIEKIPFNVVLLVMHACMKPRFMWRLIY